MVRVHFVDHDTSMDGVFVGFWAGHYILRAASAVLNEDDSYQLDGVDAVIPKERVLYMQRFQ